MKAVVKRGAADGQPGGRPGAPGGRRAAAPPRTADEVATVIVFLASPDASCPTGVAVPVDGGSTAS